VGRQKLFRGPQVEKARPARFRTWTSWNHCKVI